MKANATSQVLADIEAQNAARSKAQHEIDDLRLRRRKTLVSASVDEIPKIDAAIGCATTSLEIVEAKISSLEGELQRLRAVARDARIAADLAQGRRLTDEARALISGEYAKAAQSIARVLVRLSEVESELNLLSLRLPPDAEVGIEHPGLGSLVRLPGAGAEDPAFWPRLPRRLTLNEIYTWN